MVWTRVSKLAFLTAISWGAVAFSGGAAARAGNGPVWASNPGLSKPSAAISPLPSPRPSPALGEAASLDDLTLRTSLRYSSPSIKKSGTVHLKWDLEHVGFYEAPHAKRPDGRGVPMARVRGQIIADKSVIPHVRMAILAHRGKDPKAAPSESSKEFLSRQPIIRDGASFSIDVPILGDETHFNVATVGPDGHADFDRMLVIAVQWDRYVANWNRSPPRVRRFSVSLAAVYIGFSQTDLTPFSDINLTLRAGATLGLGKTTPWSVGLSGYITGLGFTPGPPVPYRFLGANLRIGRTWSQPKNRWTTGLHFGAFFTSMLVPDAAYGFSGLAGPQIYPTVSYELSPKLKINSYFKYSPVFGTSGLGFRNNEFAIGGHVWYLTQKGAAWTYGLDIARINVNEFDVEIGVTSVSLSVGFNF